MTPVNWRKKRGNEKQSCYWSLVSRWEPCTICNLMGSILVIATAYESNTHQNSHSTYMWFTYFCYGLGYTNIPDFATLPTRCLWCYFAYGCKISCVSMKSKYCTRCKEMFLSECGDILPCLKSKYSKKVFLDGTGERLAKSEFSNLDSIFGKIFSPTATFPKLLEFLMENSWTSDLARHYPPPPRQETSHREL